MTVFDYSLRRPIARWIDDRRVAACPLCVGDVTDTLGAPRVPVRRLSGHGPTAVDGDAVNVRGYRCDDCGYVLAIAPEAASVEVHSPSEDTREPTAPWVPMGAVFADGSKGAIVVPRREIAP